MAGSAKVAMMVRSSYHSNERRPIAAPHSLLCSDNRAAHFILIEFEVIVSRKK